MALTIQEKQLQKFFEVLATSKLPSELAELSKATATHYVVIQTGTNDAQKISVSKVRGALGTYNAGNNTPSLTNGSGVEGDSYVVSVAGSRDFGAGTVTMAVDDIIEYRNGKWILNSLAFNKTKIVNALAYDPEAEDDLHLQEAKDYADSLLAGGGDKNFLHTQGTPASTWNITHNLNKYPSVTVIDSANNKVEGDVDYPDTNNVTITFSAAFSGTATLN